LAHVMARRYKCEFARGRLCITNPCWARIDSPSLADSRKQSTASCSGDKLRWPKSQVVEVSGTLQDLHVSLCERGRLRAKCMLGLAPFLPVDVVEAKACTSLFDDEVAMVVDESSEVIARLRIRLTLKRGCCIPVANLTPRGKGAIGESHRGRQVRRAVSPRPESAVTSEGNDGAGCVPRVAEARPVVRMIHADGRSRSPGGVQTVPPRVTVGRGDHSLSPVPRPISSIPQCGTEMVASLGHESRESSATPSEARATPQREREARKTSGLPRPVSVRMLGEENAQGHRSETNERSHVVQVRSTLANGDNARPPRLEGAHLRAALSETKVLVHTEISSLRSQAQHGFEKSSRVQQLEEEILRMRKLLEGGDNESFIVPGNLQANAELRFQLESLIPHVLGLEREVECMSRTVRCHEAVAKARRKSLAFAVRAMLDRSVLEYRRIAFVGWSREVLLCHRRGLAALQQ